VPRIRPHAARPRRGAAPAAAAVGAWVGSSCQCGCERRHRDDLGIGCCRRRRCCWWRLAAERLGGREAGCDLRTGAERRLRGPHGGATPRGSFDATTAPPRGPDEERIYSGHRTAGEGLDSAGRCVGWQAVDHGHARHLASSTGGGRAQGIHPTRPARVRPRTAGHRRLDDSGYGPGFSGSTGGLASSSVQQHGRRRTPHARSGGSSKPRGTGVRLGIARVGQGSRHQAGSGPRTPQPRGKTLASRLTASGLPRGRMRPVASARIGLRRSPMMSTKSW
jgi:hypothetical protein